jgi:hypothetical protein
MDYLRSHANQPLDEPAEYRPRDQQPDRYGNAQETPVDLHGGGRLSELGLPRDGHPGELVDRQPDSLDNEQVIPREDGRAGVMVSITGGYHRLQLTVLYTACNRKTWLLRQRVSRLTRFLCCRKL